MSNATRTGTTATKSVKDSLPATEGKQMKASSIQNGGPLAIAKVIIDLFSEEIPNPPPPPPPSQKTKLLRLVTIPHSHFCEKARWALDLVQQDDANPYYYVEDTHPPGLHALWSLPATNYQQSHVPVLVFPTQEEDEDTPCPPPLCSSDAILRELCPHLYPDEVTDDIIKLEAELGQRLAATLRSVFYCSFLLSQEEDAKKKYYPSLINICTSGGDAVTAVEKKIFAAMFAKGIDKGMVRSMKIKADENEDLKNEIRQVFAELSEHVERNGLLLLDDDTNKNDNFRYWMDTPTKRYGFTAADLCIATFVCTVCHCPAMTNVGAHIAADENGNYNDKNGDNLLPPDLIAFLSELNQTAVANYARRIYAQHRPVDAATRKIVFRPARRNAFLPLRNKHSVMILIGGAAITAVAAVAVGLAIPFRKR